MDFLRRIYGIVFLVLLPLGMWGQAFNDTIDRSREDFVTVSVVICDPYEVLYSSLGHAAIRLQCPIYDLDYVFTYEGESVQNQVWRFLCGDLKMGMYAYPTDLFLQIYDCVGRGVVEYKMNLSPKQKQELWRTMDDMQTAGMTLPYDFFRRGCAKSVVRVVRKVVGPNGIHYAPWPEKYTEHTIRELVRDYITELPWTEFVLYFLIGSEAEQPMNCEEKLIVPTDLVEVWQHATFDNGKPVLDSNPHVLLESEKRIKAGWCTPLLVSLLLLVLALGSLATCRLSNRACRIAGDVVDYLLLTIQTFFGLLMTYLVCFSSLPCTEWNWLIIPFNILPAVCWYWRKWWALPMACILLVWCGVMSGYLLWSHVLVDWPHIILTMAFAIMLVKQHLK